MDALDRLVLDALVYRRHTGGQLEVIRTYVAGRQNRHTKASEVKAALDRLVERGQVERVGTRYLLSREARRKARGPAFAPSLLREDALILFAVLFGADDLEGVLAVCDYLNHAIPTLDEVHGALNRLHAAKLIRHRKGTFTPTDAAREMLVAVDRKGQRAQLARMNRLSRILACPTCGVELRKVPWRVPITDTDYNSALAAYRKSMRNAP